MLAVELFFPMFLTPAMLTLAFADPLARILGKRFGKKRILKTQKTFIGSGVFWCVAAIILFSTGAPVLTSIFVGIAAAILEIFSWSKKPSATFGGMCKSIECRISNTEYRISIPLL